MFKFNRFLLYLFLIFLAREARAQINYSETDFNFIGVGARARAMGNSHIASVEDESAIYWNPAGLTHLKDMSRISLSVLSNHENYSQTDSSTFIPDEGINHSTLNFLGIASPFSFYSFKTAVGFAYYKALDLFQDEGEFGTDVLQSSTGGVDVLAPSLAFAFSEKFSLGMSFNLFRGKHKYNDSISNDFEHNLSGENLTLGLQFHQKNITIGSVLRTPFLLKIEQPDSVINISMPVMFGLGIVYRLGENLLISSDFEIRLFSNSRAEDDKNETIQIFDVETESEKDWINWENTHILRTGLEYRIQYGKLLLPLRCGFAKIPKPNLDGKMQQINSWLLTGGFGMQTDNIQIDLSADYSVTNWNEEKSENIFTTRLKNSITILATVTVIWTK